ncbi:MAG TPA: hypothetical protein PLX66_02435 [Bacilli bacterium]|nr:hypothetical protein [Bacilli bacterium]
MIDFISNVLKNIESNLKERINKPDKKTKKVFLIIALAAATIGFLSPGLFPWIEYGLAKAPDLIQEISYFVLLTSFIMGYMIPYFEFMNRKATKTLEDVRETQNDVCDIALGILPEPPFLEESFKQEIGENHVVDLMTMAYIDSSRLTIDELREVNSYITAILTDPGTSVDETDEFKEEPFVSGYVPKKSFFRRFKRKD